MRLFIILFLLITPSIAHTEAAIKYSQDNRTVSWRKENLTVCNNISSQDIKNINNYLQLAITTWNDSGVSPTINIGNNNCDIIVTYQSVTTDNNPLAINKLNYEAYSGEIFSAEIVVNSNHDFEIGNGKNKKLFDVPSFLSHEIGHSLGLGEDMEDNQSTMYYATKRGDISKRDLNQSDLNAISKLYNNKQAIEQLNDQQVRSYGSCSISHNQNKYSLIIILLIIILYKLRQ